MRRRRPKRLELNAGKLEALLQRVKGVLKDEDWEVLEAVVETFVWLLGELEAKKVALDQLKRLLFGAKSEKTSKVLVQEDQGAHGGATLPPTLEDTAGEKAKRKGHGRNGVATYVGAEEVVLPYESLNHGDSCPECLKGKVYLQDRPGTVRVTGQAPLKATIFKRETLRCNLCDKIYQAKLPAAVGKEKYDEGAVAMVAILKYEAGMPFHRTKALEKSLGIPLPAPTQWDIVNRGATVITPIYKELVRQGAQRKVLYNDDTPMKIVALMKENEQIKKTESKARTGMFTSGIVATTDDHPIVLFVTGRKHAGENLADVLKQRAPELDSPIQMCDGAGRNRPTDFDTIEANCLSHGRRKFVDVTASFPEECSHVLNTLRQVYINDATARERELSPAERLDFHQTHSAGLMGDLKSWMTEQLAENKTEPNSALGAAIAYMLKRWEKLTLFLRQAGAPLDNNICERALKKAVLHRKNALFFKTQRGAIVGDIFMSVILTAELCGANPFDYLTTLLKHSELLQDNPHDWMPWNYQATVAALVDAKDPPALTTAL